MKLTASVEASAVVNCVQPVGVRETPDALAGELRHDVAVVGHRKLRRTRRESCSRRVGRRVTEQARTVGQFGDHVAQAVDPQPRCRFRWSTAASPSSRGTDRFRTEKLAATSPARSMATRVGSPRDARRVRQLHEAGGVLVAPDAAAGTHGDQVVPTIEGPLASAASTETLPGGVVTAARRFAENDSG